MHTTPSRHKATLPGAMPLLSPRRASLPAQLHGVGAAGPAVGRPSDIGLRVSGSGSGGNTTRRALDTERHVGDMRARLRLLHTERLQWQYIIARSQAAAEARRAKAEAILQAVAALVLQSQEQLAARQSILEQRKWQHRLAAAATEELPLLCEWGRLRGPQREAVAGVQQQLIAALTCVPLVNGALVGNGSAEDMKRLASALRRAAQLMVELQAPMVALLGPDTASAHGTMDSSGASARNDSSKPSASGSQLHLNMAQCVVPMGGVQVTSQGNPNQATADGYSWREGTVGWEGGVASVSCIAKELVDTIGAEVKLLRSCATDMGKLADLQATVHLELVLAWQRHHVRADVDEDNELGGDVQ